MRTPPILIVLMVLILGFALLGGLNRVNGIHLQPVLTVLLLVLLALLYAVALLIYRRRGMSTKRWYTLLGIFSVVLLLLVLEGFLGRFQPILAAPAAILVNLGLRPAKRERPRTR
jgi:uncharacterized membrane protein YhaH (DUF805 family)